MKNLTKIGYVTLGLLVSSSTIKAQQSANADSIGVEPTVLNSNDSISVQKSATTKKAFTQQTIEDGLSPFYIHTQLKSMHLWRGYAVTNSWMIGVDGGVATKDQKLKAGVWGGYSMNGVYKEFDYYAIYSPVKNFTFAVWDIYNYSSNATWNNTNAFDYNAKTSGRFIDLSASYTISDKLPLNLYWSTVVLGRDRTAANDRYRFSSYTQATYPVVRNKNVNLSLYAGYSFALHPDKQSKAQFYGPKAGFNNVGFVLAKDIHIGSYVMPLTMTPSWNVINKITNIQLAINLF